MPFCSDYKDLIWESLKGSKRVFGETCWRSALDFGPRLLCPLRRFRLSPTCAFKHIRPTKSRTVSSFHELLFVWPVGIRSCPGAACRGHADLAADGRDTRSIQHYMSHKNIQSTVVYAHLNPNRFQWMVQGLNEQKVLSENSQEFLVAFSRRRFLLLKVRRRRCAFLGAFSLVL